MLEEKQAKMQRARARAGPKAEAGPMEKEGVVAVEEGELVVPTVRKVVLSNEGNSQQSRWNQV